MVGEIKDSYFYTGVYCAVNSLTGFPYQEGLLLCVSVSQKKYSDFIYVYMCANDGEDQLDRSCEK